MCDFISSVELRGLDSSKTYTVKVYAENGVSHLSGSENSAYDDFQFTTEATIAEIHDIRVADYGDSFIKLEWQVSAVLEQI